MSEEAMTGPEAVDELERLEYSEDPGVAHFRADQVLCALLEAEGWPEVVAAWERVPKSYG